MSTIIEIMNISKQYRLGESAPMYGSLREALLEALRKPWKALRRSSNGRAVQAANDFWALKDVNIEVQQGETLAIIGQNGAGKSTLLKIISRVVDPTEGLIRLRGRMASLLEVGTGFHPELTGRENIYLNGAVLGMRKAEIDAKFDEIVAFAGIGQFLDTPVKRYSSGMYVRLAFAVAANLDPEILIVDEVLSVGDAAFQKKCLGKMEEVGAQGRTVLFVSHNVQVVTRLCPRAILLDAGRVASDGESHRVTSYYVRSGVMSPAERNWEPKTAPGDSVARLHAVRVLNKQRVRSEVVDIRDPVHIEVEYWNLQSRLKPTVIVKILNEDGICLFASNDWNNKQWWNTPRSAGKVRATCAIPGNILAEGKFFVIVAVAAFNS